MAIGSGEGWVLDFAARLAKDEQHLVELLRRICKANPGSRASIVLEPVIEKLTHEKRNSRREQQMGTLRAANLQPGDPLIYTKYNMPTRVTFRRFHAFQPRVRIAIPQGSNPPYEAWVMADTLQLPTTNQPPANLQSGEHAPL